MEIILKKLEHVEVLIKRQNILNKEILTLEEAAEFLQLSKSCIYKMTSNKEIPYYIPGGKKIYFRRTELESWVTTSRQTPIIEIHKEVEKHLHEDNKILK